MLGHETAQGRRGGVVYGTHRKRHTSGCKLSRHTGHTPSASAGAMGVTSPGAGDKEGTVSGEPGAGEPRSVAT